MTVTTTTTRKTIPVNFDPFHGPEIERIAPATEPQSEIWVACLLGGEPANRSYNLANSLRFRGPFNQNAMEKAWQIILNRHESLRSVFSGNGETVCIYKTDHYDLPFQDISKKTPEQRETILSDYRKQEALHVFDLLQGPLIKTGLFRLHEEEHELFITTHHSICDGWSISILLHELSLLYSSFVKGTPANLPKAPSFAEYAREQLRFSVSATYQQTEAYWVNLYKDNVPSFDLPLDFPRPPVRTFESHRLDYRIDPRLVSGLKKMGAKAGCSLATTLLAAFEVLIHRLTSKNDIIIGLPTAGQAITENTQLVGHCVNLLPLRSQSDSKRRFSDILAQCKRSVLDAHEHQRLTFGNLLKKLNIPRDRSRIPLVPIIFNFNRAIEGVVFEGLDVHYAALPKPYENFELFFNVNTDNQSVVIEWTYNTHLFKAETIDRMMMGFRNLLEAVVADDSIFVGDIILQADQGSSEKQTLEKPAEAPIPFTAPTHEVIALTAARFPTRTAIHFTNKRLTYQEVNQAANQLAHWLIQKGIQRGDLVGISVDRSPEMVITLLAVLKAGAAYLPLDPEFPQDRLVYMLEDSGAKLVLTSKKSETGLGTATPKIFIEDAFAEANFYRVEQPDVTVDGHDLAYVLYTSGSTGKPKGVLIEHHSLVNFLWSMKQEPGIDENDTLLAVTTISFDIAGLELFLPLMVGATIRMTDLATTRDGRTLLHLLQSEPITILQATPLTWRMLLDSGWNQPLLLKALCGGEPLSKDLAERLLPRVEQLWNLYGPTETTVWSTRKRVTSSERITVGRPIANTQVYILDEAFQAVPAGEVGEIWIGGTGVARGYLNRPELNQERFLANPFGAGRIYRTGDLGRIDNAGEIHCLGRMDHQVKIRGYRIELGEIEHAIRQAGSVKDTVVVAQNDELEQASLIAYVVLHDGPTSPTMEQERDWKNRLRQVLPAYMIPSRFVFLDQLPVSPNGKIDRKTLPKPASADLGVKTTMVAPRTDVEKMVLEIWQACLKIEQISITDNFFELGGNSLIAVHIMTRLEQKTGKKLPLSALFEYPTIEKLASALHLDGRSVTWDSLVPIKPNGSKVPLYIVHGAGLHVLLFNTLALSMDAEQPIYGLQAKGINSEDEPLTSIEAIAAYYIEVIRAQNPTGPFALAGYSFGGIIAYEMNRQLKQMGIEVKMLAMFDSYASQSNHTAPFFQRAWQNTATFLNERFYIFTLLLNYPSETIREKFASVCLLAKRLYRKWRYKEDYLKVFMGQYYNVDQANRRAFQTYKLSPDNIAVTLFRCRKQVAYHKDLTYLGWKPFALNGVKIYEVPGDHFSLFSPPNDGEFARILQNALDELTA